MSEPRFLALAEVMALHRLQLEAFGGQDGVRDAGGLDAAVAMPRQTFGGEYVHADLFAMAAAYAFHIAQNQCFIDGNKRAALHAALMFLAINGHPVPTDDARLYDAMIAIAERRMTKAELGELFRALSARPG